MRRLRRAPADYSLYDEASVQAVKDAIAGQQILMRQILQREMKQRLDLRRPSANWF